jgi:hypothetical protein
MMADLPKSPVQPVQPGPMAHAYEHHNFAQANARWSDWIAQNANPPGAVWADWIAKNENEPLATWLKDHPDDVPVDEPKPSPRARQQPQSGL